MHRQFSTEHITTLLNILQIYRMFLKQVFEAKLGPSPIEGSKISDRIPSWKVSQEIPDPTSLRDAQSRQDSPGLCLAEP